MNFLGREVRREVSNGTVAGSLGRSCICKERAILSRESEIASARGRDRNRWAPSAKK
jgi:hypothetical protein